MTTELEMFASAGEGLTAAHFGLTEDGTAFVEAPGTVRAGLRWFRSRALWWRRNGR